MKIHLLQMSYCRLRYAQERRVSGRLATAFATAGAGSTVIILPLDASAIPMAMRPSMEAAKFRCHITPSSFTGTGAVPVKTVEHVVSATATYLS